MSAVGSQQGNFRAKSGVVHRIGWEWTGDEHSVDRWEGRCGARGDVEHKAARTDAPVSCRRCLRILKQADESSRRALAKARIKVATRSPDGRLADAR